MKSLSIVSLFIASVTLVVAPPVKVQQEKTDKEDIDPDPAEWVNMLEYKHYMQEVLQELEKDKEFQTRLNAIPSHDNASSVADQLRFVSHNVRTRLDEIKRREIARLNMLEEIKNNKEGKPSKAHIDHRNPHTFESSDLSRLIKKVADDLVEVDNKQEDEFKEYEMAKELKRRKKLMSIKDKKAREEEEQKFNESKKRHKKHEKLHHPGSEEHLKDIWEKEDHLDRDAFDYRTFFNLHDKDSNGHLDENEIEALMMSELDKVYDENNPDDDVMERYHEMMKMRQEMVREADKNGDKMLSMDEFRDWTKKSEFKKDPEWKTTEELDKPVYTKEELKEFNKKNKIHPDEYLEDFDGFEDGVFDQPHVKPMHQEPDPSVHPKEEKKPGTPKTSGTSGEKKESKTQ